MWVNWDTSLPSPIQDYYKELFSSNHGDSSSILQYVDYKVTACQNHFLLAPYITKKIHTALFSMHLDKSLGPDGLNPVFFQTYSEIVSPKIISKCLNCFNNDANMPDLNRTNVILIPKKNTLKVVVDLRPISLSKSLIALFVRL